MNVLRIELIREVGNVKEYRIIYEETDVIETKLVGRTFNYDVDPEELNFPKAFLTLQRIGFLEIYKEVQ